MQRLLYEGNLTQGRSIAAGVRNSESYRRISSRASCDGLGLEDLAAGLDDAELERETRGRALLDGAIAYARKRRVRMLEAYPVERAGRQREDALWFGTRSMFDAAGFVEVARRKPTRPVVRLAPR